VPRILPSLLAIVLLACAASAAEPLLQRFEMDSLLDAQEWERVGTGHAFLLEEQQLVLNDNSNGRYIAFQTLLGEVTAADEMRVRGRVRVISNVYGEGMALEIARPGLEAILQLHPDRVVLTEREGHGGHRWLASAPVDLSKFRELEFVKLARIDGVEVLSVRVDGDELIRVNAVGLGGLGVGRILVGSLSLTDFGTSIWDWMELRRTTPTTATPTRSTSMAQLKELFRPR